MIFEDNDKRPTAWIEGGAILGAVLVVCTVTAWNDYQKERQFLKLNAYNEAQNIVVVIRNEKEMNVNISELKVGDIVQIKWGMSIPWDAVLVRGTGVTTDESAMTGESIELKKETMEMCEVRLEENLKKKSSIKTRTSEQTTICRLRYCCQERRSRLAKDGSWSLSSERIAELERSLRS